jgi:hypothetical protein
MREREIEVMKVRGRIFLFIPLAPLAPLGQNAQNAQQRS